MSDPSAAHTAYDPNELRRCIALSFSVSDLRTLAESLGATELSAWDRGIQEAAREVIRHFEKNADLGRLVSKLAEARPLMEWPAPLPNSAAPPEPTATNPLPFVPAAPTASATESPAKPESAPAAAPQPVIRDPFAPAFPGTTASQPTPTSPLDGRKLTMLFGIGFVVVSIVTIGLFLAVRIGKAPETTAPTEVHAGRPLRPDGPARMAADAMKRSLESLARGCDLQIAPNAEVGPWLFAAAYDQCGSRARIPFGPSDLPQNRPIPKDPSAVDPIDEPAPQQPSRSGGARNVAPRQTAPAPAKTAASEPSSGCLDKCASTKQRCSSACGAEPMSGSEYDRWQSCQTQCVSASSKCRLACQ